MFQLLFAGVLLIVALRALATGRLSLTGQIRLGGRSARLVATLLLLSLALSVIHVAWMVVGLVATVSIENSRRRV